MYPKCDEYLIVDVMVLTITLQLARLQYVFVNLWIVYYGHHRHVLHRVPNRFKVHCALFKNEVI